MTRTRSLSFAVATGLLVAGGVLALPAVATAAPGDDVLVFSNPNVVDTVAGQEYDEISASITTAGYNVSAFDGGDGSAGAWATALAGIEVFVVSDQEGSPIFNPSTPPAWMSAAAADVLVDWVDAGGTLLISGTCGSPVGTEALLSMATGVDYSGLFTCTGGSSQRYIDDAGLPATLDDANGTYLANLGSFSSAQLAPLTVWYAGENYCGDEALAVGEFAAGDGRVAFEAWDYYPDSGNDKTSWDAVLESLLNGNSAASTWVAPPAPEPKAPVTTLTDAGEELYSINGTSSCGDDSNSSAVYRVDPGTAMAAPSGEDSYYGWASQGDWDAESGISYVPLNGEGSFLMEVDPTTGQMSEVGAFTVPASIDHYDFVYGLAIGPDGAAYAILEVEPAGEDYHVPALFELDLSDGSLTLVAELDDSKLYDSYAFAVDPVTGVYYVIDEDSWELFEVDVETGDLSSLGVLSGGSLEGDGEENFSNISALQIGMDGTFWVAYSIESDSADASMIATFTLADISGGDVPLSDVGVLTDDVMETYSLLLVGGEVLAATGAAPELPLGVASLLLLLGTALIVARIARRRVA